MKTRMLPALLMLLAPIVTCAQSVALTGLVSDTPDGQSWNNGTITFTFFGPQGTSYRWTGGTLNPNAPITATLSSTGTYSASVPDNSQITPADSSWIVTVCPSVLPATSGCFKTTKVITSGSTILNLTPQSPRFSVPTSPQQITPISAYNDSEIVGGWIGFSYFNTITVAIRTCQAVSAAGACTTWSNSISGAANVFNVKSYGAHGDTQSSSNCTTSTLNLNCTDVTFTLANVNQRVSCNANGGGTLFGGTPTTFVTFVDSHNMTLGASGGGFSATCIWGTPDDTAVINAVTAAVATNCSRFGAGNLCVGNPAPILYFPAGGYNLFNTAINIAPAVGNSSGFTVKGDGKDITKIYWHEGSTNAQGAALTANGNAINVTLRDFTMDGAGQTSTSFSNAALFMSGSTALQDVIVQRFQSAGMRFASGVQAERINSTGNSGDGFQCVPCNGEIYQSVISNNAGADGNVFIQNTNAFPTGPGIRFVNSLVDECTNFPCIKVVNSTDVWFIGASAFTGMSVDGTSYVHANGGVYGPFSTDANLTGVSIASGGVVEASDARFVGSGTGKCISNSGTFINNGANTCESMFATITAASSSSTTATLTVNTQGANVSAVCGVGDTIQVQNVGVAGYNGYFRGKVTAVGTNTVSYTTPGSNLGASSGGTMFCKGFVTYSGNLPYSTITPTPNTCYVTGTFAAGTLCNQFIDRAINIYRIKASSTTTTACTVPPVVTISDGTNSATLTITTAQASWDSSVDASTNVGNTIYTPRGGTLTVSTTSGTCTTSPTNFGFTYTMQAVLDN